MTGPRIEIRPARREELAALAEDIAAFNRDPRTRCLHLGEEAVAVLREMTAYVEVPVLLVALRAGEMIGLLGCDYMAAAGRAWLWGPYVRDGDWEGTADALFARFRAEPPGHLRQIDSFQDVSNRRGHEFFLRHGFAERGEVHIYVAERPAPASPGFPATADRCPVLAPALAPAFVELHEREFPGTSRGADLLAEREMATSRIFAATDGGRLTGYVHVRRDDDGQSGYVNFLAVDPAHRRKGVARRLLATGMSWLFGELLVPRIGLNVEGGRTNARALYESAGFRLEATGRNARWIDPAAAEVPPGR